jgi:hypothetical protein
VLADSVPITVRTQWSNRVRFVSQVEWQAMSERRAARLLTISHVERGGALVRVSSQFAGRVTRQPIESPYYYAGGTTYYMVEQNGTWTTVAMTRWIT